MQVLNQTTRLELQLLQHSISTNKLEKQILDQTSEINKLQDKNRYSCYKTLEIQNCTLPRYTAYPWLLSLALPRWWISAWNIYGSEALRTRGKENLEKISELTQHFWLILNFVFHSVPLKTLEGIFQKFPQHTQFNLHKPLVGLRSNTFTSLISASLHFLAFGGSHYVITVAWNLAWRPG